MEQESKAVMAVWEKVPWDDTAFTPDINLNSKTILLQQILIVFDFDYSNSFRNVSTALDLKEMKWLPVRLSGDPFDVMPSPSICKYDHNKIVIFGFRDSPRETILGFLSFTKVLNEIHVYHERVELQDQFLKNEHSASIIGTEMYIYGGIDSGLNSDLSRLDLKTLELTKKCTCSGQDPGKLWGHQSVSVKDKLYIYGGYINIQRNIINPNIYVLNIPSLKWEKLTFCSTTHEIAQVYKEKIYFFGAVQNNAGNYLSILNTNENFWYGIARKGSIPPPRTKWLSALYEDKMIVLGGKPQGSSSKQNKHDLKEIYSFSLDRKTRDFIGEEFSKRALSFDQNLQNEESLKTVQKLLAENKDHDIIFRVQDKQIPAHRDVLSIRSSYFSNMFASGMQESHQEEIVITEVSSKAFEALLEYIYKDTMPCEEAIVKELIVYCDKIRMKRLGNHCENTLIESITEENAVEFYKISRISGAEDLREAAQQFMIKNFDAFADQLASLSTK